MVPEQPRSTFTGMEETYTWKVGGKGSDRDLAEPGKSLRCQFRLSSGNVGRPLTQRLEVRERSGMNM